MSVKHLLRNGAACQEAAMSFRRKVSNDMVDLSRKSPWTGRILAPIVSAGTLLISLALRVLSLVEPIILGIPFDLIQTLVEEEQLASFLNIFNRPVQVVNNAINTLVINGIGDIIQVGSGIITGIFYPKFAYRHYQHREYNRYM